MLGLTIGESMPEFDKWIKRVSELHFEFLGFPVEDNNHADWKEFFDEGYSPEDAITEEISYWAENC